MHRQLGCKFAHLHSQGCIFASLAVFLLVILWQFAERPGQFGEVEPKGGL